MSSTPLLVGAGAMALKLDAFGVSQQRDWLAWWFVWCGVIVLGKGLSFQLCWDST
jgi:hypothetical protein